MKTVFVIIIGICLGACYRPFLGNTIKQHLSFYEDSLVNHFPNRYKSGSFSYTIMSTLPEKNRFAYHKFFYATKYYKESNYKKLHLQIDSITKKVYEINDANLLVFSYLDSLDIGDGHIYKESDYLRKLAQRNFTLEDRLPVPWFYDEIILNVYDPSFKLHVIDAQPGIYLPEEKLYDSSKCMPEKWRHGFSRGVALCDETRQAIFGIIIW